MNKRNHMLKDTLEIIGRSEPLFGSDVFKLENKLSELTRKSKFETVYVQ